MAKKIVFFILLNIWSRNFIGKNQSSLQKDIANKQQNNSVNNQVSPQNSFSNDEFLKFEYQLSHQMEVKLLIYNGKIEFLEIMKSNKNNSVSLVHQDQNKEPFHVFNLINKNSKKQNNFLESSLDKGNYKKSLWKFKGVVDEKNNNIEYNELNKQPRSFIKIQFTKSYNGKNFFRNYIIKNGVLEVEENSDGPNHRFIIKNNMDLFNKLHIHNNNQYGGKYIIQYNNKKNNKFTITSDNNFINVDKLNLSIKSDEPKPNNFFTLWYNEKVFMEINPVDSNLSFNKCISLEKKNHHWLLKYHSTGIDNSLRKISIIYDVNRLDHTSKYNNPIINDIFPQGFGSKIKLFLIENARKFINTISNFHKILGLLLIMIIIRILIMLLLWWLERRFGIKKANNIIEIMMSQNGGINTFLVTFIDNSPIILFNIINHNSSLFLMEPFLWIKDFSWEDSIKLGWRFFTLSPLPIITSAFLNLNSGNNPLMNKKGLGYYTQKVIITIFLSFIFRYFSPVSCVYFIIYNITNYIYNQFSKNFIKIRKL